MLLRSSDLAFDPKDSKLIFLFNLKDFFFLTDSGLLCQDMDPQPGYQAFFVLSP